MELIPKCSSDLVVESKSEDGHLWEIRNGTNNTDLRETFGIKGKNLGLSKTSMFLTAEECLYARDRALLSIDFNLKCDQSIYVFYS